MDWLLWFLSFLPIWVYYLAGAAAFVAIMQVPVLGGVRTATAAAIFVFAMGYAGDIYRTGWTAGAAKGYRIGHADGLKNWRPEPSRVGKAPRYKGPLEKAQETVKPKCIKGRPTHIPGGC